MATGMYFSGSDSMRNRYGCSWYQVSSRTEVQKSLMCAIFGGRNTFANFSRSAEMSVKIPCGNRTGALPMLHVPLFLQYRGTMTLPSRNLRSVIPATAIWQSRSMLFRYRPAFPKLASLVMSPIARPSLRLFAECVRTAEHEETNGPQSLTRRQVES